MWQPDDAAVERAVTWTPTEGEAAAVAVSFCDELGIDPDCRKAMAAARVAIVAGVGKRMEANELIMARYERSISELTSELEHLKGVRVAQ